MQARSYLNAGKSHAVPERSVTAVGFRSWPFWIPVGVRSSLYGRLRGSWNEISSPCPRYRSILLRRQATAGKAWPCYERQEGPSSSAAYIRDLSSAWRLSPVVVARGERFAKKRRTRAGNVKKGEPTQRSLKPLGEKCDHRFPIENSVPLPSMGGFPARVLSSAQRARSAPILFSTLPAFFSRRKRNSKFPMLLFSQLLEILRSFSRSACCFRVEAEAPKADKRIPAPDFPVVSSIRFRVRVRCIGVSPSAGCRI